VKNMMRKKKIFFFLFNLLFNNEELDGSFFSLLMVSMPYALMLTYKVARKKFMKKVQGLVT
jgi:hypothetical protein